MMVLYDYDNSDILAETFKNNSGLESGCEVTRLMQYLLNRGLKPTALRIDDDFPKALKHFFRANGVKFQLCPPNDHRTNQK